MHENDYKSAFGQHIRKVRERKGITQFELASLMNINAQNISSYERGERCPSIFWVHRLCEALNIDITNFIEEFYSNNKK